jgi:hypothetical protein
MTLTTCAWCKGTIREGEGPASHGICPACEALYFPELVRRIDWQTVGEIAVAVGIFVVGWWLLKSF